MKTKNVMKKATALGGAVLMGATTLMGALAYDLSTYPARFIENGQFDGRIIVGEQAATADVLGSIDIAASLQASSTTPVPTEGRNRVVLSGDAFRLETGADALELREPIGDVVDTITSGDLEGLRSGRITTSEGTTEYNQYLRLQDQNNLQDMAVNYIENDDNVLGDYLVVDTGLPFLEWEIQFPTGLESTRETDNRLTDLEDRGFNILGTDYSIVRAAVTTGNVLTMTLMGGSIADTMREGETKTYTIEGVDYEVTLVFVSDPSSAGQPEVKFSVNGEITQALAAGDTDTLSGGLQIGVRDILVNPREGVASFYLGAQKLVIDDNAGTNTFDGSIEINNENINDGEVDVYGQFSGANDYKITSIRYRLTMDAESGAVAYVPSGQGLRQLMRRPDALLSESLDIRYEGLESVNVTDMRIAARGDDRYEIEFTNIEGQEYTMPFVSNRNGIWKFGSDNDDLIFVEPSNTSGFNIGRNDYFVVSNARGDLDKSVTNVLRYDDFDTTDRTIELRDLATGSTFSVPITNSTGNVGEGNLVIGGHTYRVRVADVTNRTPNIGVDLNSDGSFNAAEVGLTTWGGVVVDLAVNVTNAAGSGVNITSAIGNGVNMGTSGSSGAIEMSARVLAKNFDDSTQDEVINWTLQQAAGDEVTLDFGTSDYLGPRNNNSNEYTRFEFTDLEGDDERQTGLTDWGILIQEYDPSGDSPSELTLRIPRNQIYPQVFVVMGNTTGGGNATRTGGATRVNPIAVGIAVLDRDAPRVGTENMIVVGGPCANTVAAELMDVDRDTCGEDFEQGRAFIRTFENGGNVAILVAGYEATETLGASRVLANYNNYDLRGTEMEIVVADLNDIRVQGTGTRTNTTRSGTTTRTSDTGDDNGFDNTSDDETDDGFGTNNTTNRTNGTTTGTTGTNTTRNTTNTTR